VVVDYPNSTKAKKFFLVLMTAGGQALPKALGTGAADHQVSYEQRRSELRSFVARFFLSQNLPKREKIYQMTTNYAKRPEIVPKGRKNIPNGH
jgi:hypothetical protein